MDLSQRNCFSFILNCSFFSCLIMIFTTTEELTFFSYLFVVQFVIRIIFYFILESWFLSLDFMQSTQQNDISERLMFFLGRDFGVWSFLKALRSDLKNWKPLKLCFKSHRFSSHDFYRQSLQSCRAWFQGGSRMTRGRSSDIALHEDTGWYRAGASCRLRPRPLPLAVSDKTLYYDAALSCCQ